MPETISSSIKYVGTDLLVVGRSIASIEHPVRNEDRMAYDPYSRVALVLDGSSGSDDGLRAAVLGEAFLFNRLSGAETHLPRSIRRMGSALEEAAHHLRESGYDLHTTASASKFTDFGNKRYSVYGHIGDSRDFLFRDNELSRITQDHDLVNAARLPAHRKKAIAYMLDEIVHFEELEELKRQGSDIFKYWENQNWVAQILGRRETKLPDKWRFKGSFKAKTWVSPSVGYLEVFTGDCLIKASDGLNNLAVSEMEQLLRGCNAQDMADVLAEAAFKRSMDFHVRAVPDDITVLVTNIGEKIVNQ